MFLRKLLLLCLFPLFLYSDSNTSFFQEYMKLNIHTAYTYQNRKIDVSKDIIEATVFPVLSASLEIVLLPKTYNLKLAYTRDIIDGVDDNLYNPKGYDDTTSFLELSMIPYYNKDYGGLGIFYTSAQQNSKYTNNANTDMPINKYDMVNGTLPLLPVTTNLPANQSYQSKEKVDYLGIKYMLPTYKYLPKGANIYYSQMDRTTVYYANFANQNQLIEISGKGKLYGFGLQRELHDIKLDVFSLDLLQFSKGGFSGFPDLELYETSVGGVYKSKNFYIKAFALVYVAKEFSYQFFSSETLTIPQTTDTLLSVKLGTTF